MLNDNSENGRLLLTCFKLGNADFGVDAKLVLEVVKFGELTQVHGAPASVIGIRNLRGHIVTVMDMAIHLNLGSVLEGPDSRLLIMEHKGESYGFLVDSVTDAIAIDTDHIGTPPVSLSGDLRNRLHGVWRDNERLTAILDPKTLFQWEGDTSVTNTHRG